MPSKNSKLPKFLFQNSCLNGHISINTSQILTNEGSKSKLDCAKFESGLHTINLQRKENVANK